MHRTHLLIALLCLFLPGALHAQETPPPAGGDRDTRPPGERPPMRRGGEFRSYGEHGGGFQRNRSDGFEAWMKRIKEQDPAEYERLQRLKEEDPQALRQALRERLQAERSRRLLEQDERLRKIVESLTEKDRAYLMSRLSSRDHASSRSNRPRDEHRKGEESLRELAEAVRQAEDPARKKALTDSLRTKLAAQHDRKAAERAAFLEKMSARLKDLRAQMEDHETRRDELIDQHLKALIEGVPPPRQAP